VDGDSTHLKILHMIVTGLKALRQHCHSCLHERVRRKFYNMLKCSLLGRSEETEEREQIHLHMSGAAIRPVLSSKWRPHFKIRKQVLDAYTNLVMSPNRE
jgi:hypothetical protein